MTLVEHLEELRGRILKGLVAVGLGWIAAYFFVDEMLEILAKPVGTLYFFSPAEAFLTRLKISFGIGAFLALPVILDQIRRFVAPACSERLRRSLLALPLIGFLLFAGGAAFSFFLILPPTMKFLLGYGSKVLTPYISLEKYISLVLWITFGVGALFEWPLLAGILAKAGILTPEFLRHWRKHAMVGIFVLSAIVTPTQDMFVMMMVAVPGVLLYEVSIGICALFGRSAT